MNLPAGLQSFANADGRVSRLPVKWSKKVELARWLLELLEPNRSYSEAEVSEIFEQHVDDFALMRRLLVDQGLMTRDAYGREYRVVQA